MTSERIIVYHRTYGCDTGCCGHVIERGDDHKFNFTHPYNETDREFVKRVVTEQWGEEHVADIDWDNVIVIDD